MRLHIKNMVCDRCKAAVKTSLQSLGLNPISVELGNVLIAEEFLSQGVLKSLSTGLADLGFELLENHKQKVVEAVKSAVIELVHYTKEPLTINLSTFLAEKLNTDYQTLSLTFSELEENTIEKYFIAQKLERVKELLSYGNYTLSQIANLLNYSSVAHLSAQFKKVLGYTPSQYKQMLPNRITLDAV